MIGWIVGGLLAWAAVAFGAAVVVGRAIAAADERCCPHPDLDDEFSRLADGGAFL